MAVGWVPPQPRVVRREGLKGLVARARGRVQDEWARHATVPDLLRDYFPEEWEKVRGCRAHYRRKQRADEGSEFTATPRSCWRYPYCPLCTRVDNWNRAVKGLEAFFRVTPRGQPVAVYHWVVTAALTQDGQSWGVRARGDVDAFFRAMAGAFREVLGDGCGMVMSYQDFGERPFTKPHPHMDVVVNGYRVRDSGAVAMARPELKGGGYDRVAGVFQKFARSLDLGAAVPNVNVKGPYEGVDVALKKLKYSLRHMVDFGKYEYRRGAQMVYHGSYHDERVDRVEAPNFVRWFDEYCDRFGQYRGRKGRVELHRRFGHLGDRRIKATRALVGGEVPDHPAACRCRECVEWVTVLAAEDEGEFSPTPPSPSSASTSGTVAP